MINYLLANSVHKRIDLELCVAYLDFADDVALLGVSDSEDEANLHRIEFLAEDVGLKINVGKTKNMDVKCEHPVASVTFAQKNVGVLTRNHKDRVGTLIEAKNQSRLLIVTELLMGKNKNVGWLETIAGEKLILKSLSVAELVILSIEERSVVADLVSTATNRLSAVADDETRVCSDCKRRFDTAKVCKSHEARFCKFKKSKIVKDSESKFVGLEKSITYQNCTSKFTTENSR